MTDLSSAAQAVWRAHEQVLGDECVLTKTDMKALAAALRAAADQWKNEIRKQPNTEFISGIKNCIDALNEVAAELEAQ